MALDEVDTALDEVDTALDEVDTALDEVGCAGCIITRISEALMYPVRCRYCLEVV